MKKKNTLKKIEIILLFAVLLIAMPLSNDANAILRDCGELAFCDAGTGCHFVASVACEIFCHNPVTGESIGSLFCNLYPT